MSTKLSDAIVVVFRKIGKLWGVVPNRSIHFSGNKVQILARELKRSEDEICVELRRMRNEGVVSFRETFPEEADLLFDVWRAAQATQEAVQAPPAPVEATPQAIEPPAPEPKIEQAPPAPAATPSEATTPPVVEPTAHTPAPCGLEFSVQASVPACIKAMKLTREEAALVETVRELGMPAFVEAGAPYPDIKVVLDRAFARLRSIWRTSQAATAGLHWVRNRHLLHFTGEAGVRPSVVWVYFDGQSGYPLRACTKVVQPKTKASCSTERYSSACAAPESRLCAQALDVQVAEPTQRDENNRSNDGYSFSADKTAHAANPTALEAESQGASADDGAPAADQETAAADLTAPSATTHAVGSEIGTGGDGEASQEPRPRRPHRFLNNRRRPQAERRRKPQLPKVRKAVKDLLVYLGVLALEHTVVAGSLDEVLDLRPVLEALLETNGEDRALTAWQKLVDTIKERHSKALVEALDKTTTSTVLQQGQRSDIERLLEQLLERCSKDIAAVTSAYKQEQGRTPGCRRAIYEASITLHNAIMAVIRIQPVILTFTQLQAERHALPTNADEVLQEARTSYAEGEKARATINRQDALLAEIEARLDEYRQTARAIARRLDALLDLWEYAEVQLSDAVQRRVRELQEACSPSRFRAEGSEPQQRIPLPAWWDGLATELSKLEVTLSRPVALKPAPDEATVADEKKQRLLSMMVIVMAQHIKGEGDEEHRRPKSFLFYARDVLRVLGWIEQQEVAVAVAAMKELAVVFFGHENPEQGAPTSRFFDFAAMAAGSLEQMHDTVEAIEGQLAAVLPDREAPRSHPRPRVVRGRSRGR